MANRFAVGSGVWSATSGVWAQTEDGAAGSYVPATDDVVTIQDGVIVDVDVTTAVLTSLLIQSHATNPGTLRWKDAADGILRIKSVAVATNKVYGNATSATCRGRILCNQSGLWTGSTASATIMASQSGISGAVSDGGGAKRVFTPTVSPAWVVDALIGESMTINGSTYAIEDNDATTVTLTTGPAIGATVTAWALVVRPLPADHTAKIMLGALATVESRYLDVLLHGMEPTLKSVRTYGQVFHECTVSAAADTITFTGIDHALPVNTIVRVSAGSGALPAELAADTDYWVQAVGAEYITLKATSGGGLLGLSAGGPINVHCGWYDTWTVNVDNTLTKNAHGLANATAVMVHSSNGVYPTPLAANTLYYVVSTATDTIKLAAVSAGPEIDITSVAGIGTISVYTGSTGAAPGLGGTNPYTSIMVNVLDNVTADSAWVGCGDASTWQDCTTKSAVCVVDAGPADVDAQRVAVKTITAATMTLSAAIDSSQYPGARIWLCSRNVAIQSEATTSISVVEATNSTGSVWACEIRVRTATVAAYGVSSGASHTISGSIAGCTTGVYYGASHTISGSIAGCLNGVNSGVSHTISGPIAGCTYGVNSGTSHIISGSIAGCTNGVATGVSHIISGSIAGCTNGVYSGTSHTISGSIAGCTNGCRYCEYLTLVGGSIVTSATTDVSCNLGDNSGMALVRAFDYGGTANDVRAWTMGGTVTHDTASVFVAATGLTYSRKFTHTSASYYSLMEWDIAFETLGTLSIPCYVQHDASGLTAAERVTFGIYDPIADPLKPGTGGVWLDTWTADDSTSVQTHTLSYVRADKRPLRVRVFALRASGNAWFLIDEYATASVGGGRPEIRGSNL